MSPGKESMAAHLAAFLRAEAEAEHAEVRALRRLAGGSSREIWALEVELRGGPNAGRLDLVMRRDPPGRTGEGSRDLEFRVVQVAHAGGVPVPRPWWACTDASVLGSAFYLMDRVEGEALPRRLLRDERYAKTREVLTQQLAEILARIHAIDPDLPALQGLEDKTRGGSSALTQLEETAAGIRELAGEPHPALDLAERWLRERIPRDSRRTLVHGDYRVGNVLFDERGVQAVLDWELCKIGDPVEDLGWLCTHAWRFGSPHPVGGVGSREELLRAYEAASGTPVDPQHLRFWEALGSYKVALVFIMQSWWARSGKLDSLELAALGRRTAEAEQELVRLMDEAEDAT